MLVGALRDVGGDGREEADCRHQGLVEDLVGAKLGDVLVLLPCAPADELHVPAREVVEDEGLQFPHRLVGVVLLHLVVHHDLQPL